MAVRTFRKCPFCGKAYSAETLRDHTGRWGSPFFTCAACGKVFVDTSRIEPALLPLEEPDLSFKRLLFVNLFPYGLLALLFLAAAVRAHALAKSADIAMGIAAAVLFALYWIRVYQGCRTREEVLDRTRRLYEESRKRLLDPMYAVALRELGYAVPEEFLPAEPLGGYSSAEGNAPEA